MSGDYRTFLRARAPEAFRPGPIVDEAGREVGAHAGLGGYTVGQRRGLGRVGPEPAYVVAARPGAERGRRGSPRGAPGDPARGGERQLDRGPGPDGAARGRGAGAAPRAARPGARRAWRRRTGRGLLHEPQYAVTPGQSVVLYRGEVVVGGGVIACAA